MSAMIIDEKSAADILLRLIKVYTPSGEERRLHGILKEIARRLGYDEAYGDEVGNFIMSYGEGAPILLASHIDTVPGELEAGIREGRVYGRGAVDAKGPLTAMILGAAMAQPHVRNLRVFVAGLAREETDGRGARYLIEKGFRAEHILIGEPTGLRIAVAYRGSVTAEVYAEARGGHSSAPYVGESALDKILGLLGKVKEKYGGASYDEPTSAITVLKAGEWPGSLPDKAYAVINIRFPTGYKAETILETIRSLSEEFGVRLRIIDATEPVEVGLNTPIVRALMRGMLSLGMKPHLVKKTGTSDMNTLHEVTGSIAAFGPGDSKLAHTMREALSIDDLLAASQVISEMLKELSRKL